MAYAATVTVNRKTAGGRRYLEIVVSETECATASEWSTAAAPSSLSGGQTYTIPPNGRIVSRRVHITAGTAVQVAPVLARATGVTSATSKDAIVVEGAAAYLNDVSEIPFRLAGGVLYGRSQPQGGSTDNSITTEILIAFGGA